MAMRASFNGRLSWSMVNINIKAYSVIESAKEHLHILHDKCSAPIERPSRCTSCGKIVPPEEQVRGAVHGEGWVVLTKADIESILPEPEEGRPITVHGFVDPSTVNPLWYDKPYYLTPADARSERAYTVLSRVLREEKASGVVTFVCRNAYHLGMVVTAAESLVLFQVHFPDHIRALKDYGIESEPLQITKGEIDLGRQLVARHRIQFKHSDYRDPVPQSLQRLIEAKAKGKKLAPLMPALQDASPVVIDLKQALEQSLRAVGKNGKQHTAPAKQTKKQGGSKTKARG